MQRDLVDFLLKEFRERPGMFLGSYSVSKLSPLIAGFMVACNFYNKEGLDRFDNFINWFHKKYSLEKNSSWTSRFLELTNNDENAALDLFFLELEEYAIEFSIKQI